MYKRQCQQTAGEGTEKVRCFSFAHDVCHNAQKGADDKGGDAVPEGAVVYHGQTAGREGLSLIHI